MISFSSDKHPYGNPPVLYFSLFYIFLQAQVVYTISLTRLCQWTPVVIKDIDGNTMMIHRLDHASGNFMDCHCFQWLFFVSRSTLDIIDKERESVMRSKKIQMGGIRGNHILLKTGIHGLMLHGCRSKSQPIEA